MIKNLVFDIYNVIIRFNREKQIRLNNLTQDDLDFIWSMFGNDLWNECDLGKYYGKSCFTEQLIEMYPAREKQIRRILSRPWSTYMECIERVTKYFEPMSKDYDLYIISNICEEEFDFVRNQPWFRFFKGHHCSFEAGIMKPDKEIFTQFLDKYGLKAEECLFIDDSTVNLQAAGELGFNVIQFDGKKNYFSKIKKSL